MRTLPPEPSPGDKITANLIREIIRAIRERTPLDGVDTKVSIGPNGFRLHPRIASDKKAPADVLPWSFSCSEDGNGERTGGWTNCIFQLGYGKFFHSPDIDYVWNADVNVIEGTDETDDGDHYLEVDLKNETAKIVANPQVTANGLSNDIVRVRIGHVVDGELENGIHHHPVIYKYV